MNAILTLAVGENYELMKQYTHPSIEAYAEKIGADFICIKESSCSTPHWEKFNAIFNLLNKYKRILYLDTDMIIREDCPNLFDEISEYDLGIFDEAPYTTGRIPHLLQTCKEYGIRPNKIEGRYYNTGVMVISRRHKQLFVKPEKEYNNFFEQSYLNAVIAKNETPVEILDYRFNRMTCLDPIIGIDRHDSYIIHYAGYPSLETAISLIQKDLKIWEQNKGQHFYNYHIVVDVQGGMGDQICAEPAIRYLINNVYKGEDIRIKTHFPRLFEHLDVPVYYHSEIKSKPDTPYYHVITLPGPETINWKIVSNLLCHTVDYASMALLARTLPNKEKTYKVNMYDNDMKYVKNILGDIDYENLILIHPGRHWDSKTFPIQWWQEVIDGISEEKQVCLIGREEKTRGTLPVEVRENVLDTRNLLDLGAYMALISMSNTVVSNDSSPVHIAGYFDTNIVLIPTCKHPDHILPWRKNKEGIVTQYHKSYVLYDKLVLDDIDSKPTTINGSSAEFTPGGDLLKYLPKPIEVIETVLKM